MALPIYQNINVVDVVETIITNMKEDGETLYYYHGTPLEVDVERKKDRAGNTMKTPFICLFEPFDQDDVVSRENVIGTTADLWLVFMTSADYKNWTTDEFYDNAIDDMNDLLIRFINQCEKEVGLVLFDQSDITYTRRNHARWGLTLRDKGANTPLFNDQLSGVEIQGFRLPILKSYSSCISV